MRRKEEARLADEADMEELRRIEDEAKKRGKDAEGEDDSYCASEPDEFATVAMIGSRYKGSEWIR